MKSGIIIVFIAVAAFAFAIPAIEDAKGGSDYFKKKLHEIQGAIDDTINAGKDLEDMEERLQDIVNLSSYFFRTESSTEYAVDAEAYANGWTPAGPAGNIKVIVKQDNGKGCKSAAECKSDVCERNSCRQGNVQDDHECEYDEQCASKTCLGGPFCHPKY